MIQLFELFVKFDFGGIMRFFRFLDFGRKNLKPKKCILGVKNEKIKNQNIESGREKKVSFMKVCLFFKKYEGKSDL